jgi:hypothetical protein
MGARAIERDKLHEAASLREISRELDRVAPGAPLLALGQTPLWDEPMKAIIAAGVTRPMIVGIHDLDYFSRVRSPLSQSAWQIVPRNDGATRDVWIAAGEISALFGAEVWPTRQTLTEAGLRLDRLLPALRSAAASAGEEEPEGPAQQEILGRLTEAFGWRGIVRNGPDCVVCDAPASEVAPALLELLEWASSQTQADLARPQDRKSVRATISCCAEAVKQFIAERPSDSVGDLFARMLRGFYEGFLGALPPNVTIAGARELLAFNRRTADLPRFQFAAHFLDEAQSAACRAAYDAAAGDSSMSRLAASGEGALPFDVYAPGRGRGTLRVGPAFVAVDFPEPVQCPLTEPVRDVHRLAEILEDALGGGVALMGKALALPAMLSAEFVMIFTETGSAYIPRTQRMLAAMRESGIQVRANPLLRMRLRTWDSLSVCGAALRLPEHLAQAFGKRALDCKEFSRRWRSAVKEQQRLLHELKGITGACDLVRYLGHDQHAAWFRRLRQCAKANALLLKIQRQADELRHKALDLRAREDSAVAEIRMLETRRGAMSRESIRPLKRKLADLPADAPADERALLVAEFAEAEFEGGALLLSLEEKQKELRHLREKRSEIARRLLALERGHRAAAARRLLLNVERAAEKARLQLVRNALLASEGLPHADLRPSAWWFPALDPTGRWFARVRRTATFRLEPLID